MNNIRLFFISIIATAFGISVLGEQIPPKALEACDVVWSTPGKTSDDSMQSYSRYGISGQQEQPQ